MTYKEAPHKIHTGEPRGLSGYIEYLQRDHVTKSDIKPELFTDPGSQFPTDPIQGEKQLFYLILFPKNGASLDMQQFTRQFIQDLNSQRSAKLQRLAVIHDTSLIPHSHIAIRGLDADGNEVHFDSPQ